MLVEMLCILKHMLCLMHEGNIEGEVDIEDKCLQLLFVFF